MQHAVKRGDSGLLLRNACVDGREQRAAAGDEAAKVLLGPELQKRITREGVSGTAGVHRGSQTHELVTRTPQNQNAYSIMK